MQINRGDNVIQFEDLAGSVIVTPLATLTVIRTPYISQNKGEDDFYRYFAFYGTKGRSEISETLFNDVHAAYQFNLPE